MLVVLFCFGQEGTDVLVEFGVAKVVDGHISSRHCNQQLLDRLERFIRGPATLVITSPSAAADIWTHTIIPHIHKRILVLSPSLRIELLCGSALEIASQGVPASLARTYRPVVSMGASIGQQDLKAHSSTAGGKVKLSDGMSYALTNHHVTRNDSTDNSECDKRIYPHLSLTACDIVLSKSSEEAGEQLPLKPGHSIIDPSKHRITCPSNEDNAAFIEEHERYETEWLAQKKHPESEQQLAYIRTELKMARETERSFGTVYASSGLRTINCEKPSSNSEDGQIAGETGKSHFRFLLDWSLLSFHPKRGMSDFLPPEQQRITHDYSTIVSVKQCSRWTVMNNPKCHILRDEVSGGKCGRTTGLTYWTCEPDSDPIDPGIGGQFKFTSATKYLTVEDFFHSMSFVAHSGVAVEKGDSSSIVLHAPSGDWLGLLFGETSAKSALLTPIDLVFRDIEKVTGHKVVEPVFNKDW